MSTMLAIAHKELKSYFSSPIAYVMLGFFVLIFGWFYAAILFYFEQQSNQFGALGAGREDVPKHRAGERRVPNPRGFNEAVRAGLFGEMPAEFSDLPLTP
jgi:hypothetical protein